jgi:glycosyltransferase involved in cell wall biosynthesis
MSRGLRRFQGLALRLTSIIPGSYRAVCLTTLYELYRVLGGHTEAWIDNAARNPSGGGAISRVFPLSWRRRLYGTAYVMQLHRKGHVLPGVWRVLGTVPNERKRSTGLPKSAFPHWMVNDLHALSQSEGDLFPNENFFARFFSWRPHADISQGEQLALQWDGVGRRKFEVVVLAPWLNAGGADKGVLQYLEFYRQRFESVLLLTTYPAPSTRLDRVPASVVVRELGASWRALSQTEQSALLARFLLILRPRIIHNVLSETAWLTYVNHGKALRVNGSKLLASLFTEELAHDGHRVGYAVNCLPQCRNVLDVLMTDSRRWADEFSGRYALRRTAVMAVHFYFDQAENATVDPPSNRHSPRHVLWAGRLSREKRPDLLLEIARRLPEVTFHVWGPTDRNSVHFVKRLKKEANVRLHGEYAKFSDISQVAPYAAFLYTTAFDGMPHVVLEAVAAGVSVVAPNHVGGLSDLLDESTAFCIENENDVSSYVGALKLALEQPQLAMEKASKARMRLNVEFSKKEFMENMTAVINNVLDEADMGQTEKINSKGGRVIAAT